MPSSKDKLSDPPPAPEHEELENSHLILVHAHDAAKALLAAFDVSRGKRRKTGGTTTDEEQDLLRAMLVFAGAGLDASVKRVIQDALPLLAKKNPAARTSLQVFAARRLRDEARAADSAKGYDLLASALASDSPQSAVVAAYVEDLIGSSLQSPERVFEALGALGLHQIVNVDRGQLKTVFDNRNKIIHEMDMDLSSPNRRRTSRRRDPMIVATNSLLTLGAKVLASVDQGLK